MKKIKLNIEDLFEIPTARIFNPDNYRPVNRITIDSRQVKKGSMYIAIKGKKFDGHSFVKSSVQDGAAAVLINRRRLREFDSINVPIITVDNTTKALGAVANTWRKKLNARVIGITGSTGKTSTKDMLATLLSEKYHVNKTIGNNNNHIGVPLTILSTNEKHDVLIVELGTNHFGEIEYTANILEPDYSLITNIGHSHTAYLKNKSGVFREKSRLNDITRKNKGVVFINYDDPMLKGYSNNLDDFISFGFNDKVDVKGKITSYTNDGKPVVRVKYKSKILENSLPVYGEHNAFNYIAAVSIALELGISREQLQKSTSRLEPTDRRLNVYKKKNFILIDDTYNASPESMKAAIKLTNKINTYHRKVLVLGDMFELGKDKIKLHQSLATIIINNRIDELYCIGNAMKSLTDRLKSKKITTRHFRTRKSFSDFLKNYNFKNKVILTKGSRAMRMEEFTQIILSKATS
ncbi:UDP-N-acetylmuramoyl-tripeptide--D-alanyl-D-alanine ligase [Bacteroidota bacterium]